MSEKIKPTLLAAIVMAVLCAGTISARQLRSNAKQSNTCGGTCSQTQPCISASSKCVCSFTTPLTGFCTTKLVGVVGPKK